MPGKNFTRPGFYTKTENCSVYVPVYSKPTEAAEEEEHDAVDNSVGGDDSQNNQNNNQSHQHQHPPQEKQEQEEQEQEQEQEQQQLLNQTRRRRRRKKGTTTVDASSSSIVLVETVIPKTTTTSVVNHIGLYATAMTTVITTPVPTGLLRCLTSGRGRRRSSLRDPQHYEETLRNDACVQSFTSSSVVCAVCHKVICLRRDYYLFYWNQHKSMKSHWMQVKRWELVQQQKQQHLQQQQQQQENKKEEEKVVEEDKEEGMFGDKGDKGHDPTTTPPTTTTRTTTTAAAAATTTTTTPTTTVEIMASQKDPTDADVEVISNEHDVDRPRDEMDVTAANDNDHNNKDTHCLAISPTKKRKRPEPEDDDETTAGGRGGVAAIVPVVPPPPPCPDPSLGGGGGGGCVGFLKRHALLESQLQCYQMYWKKPWMMLDDNNNNNNNNNHPWCTVRRVAKKNGTWHWNCFATDCSSHTNNTNTLDHQETSSSSSSLLLLATSEGWRCRACHTVRTQQRARVQQFTTTLKKRYETVARVLAILEPTTTTTTTTTMEEKEGISGKHEYYAVQCFLSFLEMELSDPGLELRKKCEAAMAQYKATKRPKKTAAQDKNQNPRET